MNEVTSRSLSTRELAGLYFGRPEELKRPFSTRSDLTPTGRYLIQVARKKIAEQTSGTPSERELLSFVADLETHEGEFLTDRERTAVVSILTHSFEDFGILSMLIEDPSVNDIIVRGFDDISVQKNRRNYATGLSFGDSNSYRAFVEQLLKRAGKACTTATPVIDAAHGENVRLCVTHESPSPKGDGPLLTIRIARHSSISLAGLIRSELAPQPILTYLGALVSSGECTLLISGEVGTGKTTLVRALAGEIPETEAVLIIEDTEEIRLNRAFTRTLLTREANTEGVGKISPSHAIRAGMRMAMNRIILGEMRDAEAAESFIDVCASGHPGVSTIHARSARDALSRLELFLSRAQPGVGIETVRRQISNAISAVVHLGVDSSEQTRRILEVAELGSSADGFIQLSPIFGFDSCPNLTSPTWKRMSGVSRFNDALRREQVSLPLSGEKLSTSDSLTVEER
jgi:pilus assembly protein CpaF